MRVRKIFLFSFGYHDLLVLCFKSGLPFALSIFSAIFINRSKHYLIMILGKWPTWHTILYIYFNSLNVSSNPVLIIRRINCINTVSGICHTLSVTVSCAGPTCTRNVHRHRLTYTRDCIDTIDSPDDEHGVCSKRVENWSKYIELCVKLVIYQES